MKKHLALLIAVFGFSTTQGQAQIVLNQTYNSGFSGGVALTAGSKDNDFTIVSAPSGQSSVVGTHPVVPTSYPVGYWATPSTAKFISPTPGQGTGSSPYGDLPGYYDYQTVLSTDFLAPTSVTISGAFLADNTADVKIDGTIIATGPSSPTSEYSGTPNPFTDTLVIGSGIQLTTIDFVVENYNSNDSVPPTGSTPNPTGLLVSGLTAKANAAPEPSTWLMLFAGVGALGFVQRLRRASDL